MGDAGDRIEQRHRLRDDALPQDTVVALRGGPDTVAKIVRHADRTEHRWALDGKPLVGVSVFCALDPDGPGSLDGLLAGRMRSYRVVHRVPAGKLFAAGFELLPTAGRPHYTIRMMSGEEAEAAKLLAVLGPPRENQQHESHVRRAGMTTMIRVDIAADLNDEDGTGFVWTYLADARDPSLIRAGSVVTAGEPDSPAVCEVVDLVEEPTGTIVHLRLLPGTIEDYEALVRRAGIPA